MIRVVEIYEYLQGIEPTLWSQFLNSNIYRYRDSERRCKCSKIGVRRNSHFGIDFWVKHGFHSENALMGLIKQ